MKKLKYLSPEWRDEVEKRLHEQFDTADIPKVTAAMNNQYHNCPDGKDKYYYVAIVDGKITSVEIGEGEGPDAEFKIIGDYEVFAQVTRCEMNAQKALMCGKFKFKGNLVKGLKLASLADRLNKISAGIPTEF